MALAARPVARTLQVASSAHRVRKWGGEGWAGCRGRMKGSEREGGVGGRGGEAGAGAGRRGVGMLVATEVLVPWWP